MKQPRDADRRDRVGLLIILYLLPFDPQPSLTICAGNIIRAKGVGRQRNKVCIMLPLLSLAGVSLLVRHLVPHGPLMAVLLFAQSFFVLRLGRIFKPLK